MKKATIVILAGLMFWGCGRSSAGTDPSVAPEALAFTRWTERTELFLEYPPLVAGQVSRFSVHLTELTGFKPLTEGRVIVELKSPDGSTASFATDGPSRPGIFGLDVRPAKAGPGTLIIRLESAKLNDVHDVGAAEVFATSEDAARAASGEAVDAISFLKEQQWTLDFATAVVGERPLREGLRVPAEILPRTGGEAEVIAPVAGRVAAGGDIPAPGTAVRQGQILARIVPKIAVPADRAALELSVTEAASALALAEKNLQRTERLASAGAVPARRLDESAAAAANARARLDAARSVLSQHELTRSAEGRADERAEFVLRAPIAGVVAGSAAFPGSGVEEGQSLFRIVSVDPVYVAAFVPEAESGGLSDLTEGEMEVPGEARPVPLNKVISVGRVVDTLSRTVSVIFELSNPEGRLAVGRSVFVRLFTGRRWLGLALPESAIVDDTGRPVVFVQVAGESFLRRAVRLGVSDSGFVGVLEGLKAGERIVTTGAYQIRLAALSPQVPASGHVH